MRPTPDQYGGQLHVIFDITAVTALDGFVERTHRLPVVLDAGFGLLPGGHAVTPVSGARRMSISWITACSETTEPVSKFAAENAARLTMTPLPGRDFDRTNRKTYLSSHVRRTTQQHLASMHQRRFNNTAVLASVLQRSARLSDGTFAVRCLNSQQPRKDQGMFFNKPIFR